MLSYGASLPVKSAAKTTAFFSAGLAYKQSSVAAPEALLKLLQ